MDIDDLGLSYTTDEHGNQQLQLHPGMREFVIEFIRTTAVKSPAEIAAVVQQGQDNVLRNINGLTDEQAQFKPAPDQWCILDAMAHIVSVKRMMSRLSSGLGRGEMPPGYGPHLEEAKSQDGITIAKFDTIADARDAAVEAHADMLDCISRLDGAQTELRFSHFFFGAMNSREWCVFYRVHDGDHAPHILKIRNAPGFPDA